VSRSESVRKHWASMPKEARAKKVAGMHSKESREKVSKMALARFNKFLNNEWKLYSEEEREKLMSGWKERIYAHYHFNKEKISQQRSWVKKAWWARLTPEEKKAFGDKLSSSFWDAAELSSAEFLRKQKELSDRSKARVAADKAKYAGYLRDATLGL